MVMVRALFTLVFLKIFFVREPVPWTHRGLISRSFFGGLFVCSFYIALSKIPVPDVLAIVSTLPVWIALLFLLIYRIRPVPVFWAAVISMIVGVAALEHVTPTTSGGGVLVAVLAAIFSASGFFSIDHCRGVKSSVITFHLMVAVFVLGLAGTVIDRGSNLEVLLNSDIQTWGILAGMSIFAMAFQLSVVNAAKLGGSLAASFATILSVILTTGLHFLMGDFMWQSAVATLFILIPCVLFVVGVIPMPRRNAGDAVEQ